MNYLDVTTLGTAEASKAVTADASGHVSMNDKNITNVGDVALDSLTGDGSSITINTDTSLASGVDIETSTTGKIKQKGSAFQNHITASLAFS